MAQTREWERGEAAGLSARLNQEREEDGCVARVKAVAARTCKPQTERSTARKGRENNKSRMGSQAKDKAPF
jgi:hypothetical protein